MGPIAVAITRSSSRLTSTISAAAARASSVLSSSFPPPQNPRSPSPPSSPPAASTSAARHLSDWRSPLSHRAQIRSSAAVTERFERRFSTMATKNSYEGILTTLSKPGGGEVGKYYSLPALNDPRIDRLPYSIRILLESAIRNCDEFQVTGKDVEKILDWENTSPKQVEIPFKPARVLLQDFTGVPAVVDLACMRDAMNRLGSDSNKINPLVPVDLVIDHSVQVDVARSENAVQANMELEFQRNKERFGFLKWGSKAFRNMLVVPPGSGIVHQVNLEYLGRVVFNNEGMLYPDSVVGTDSHTTMIDGLGVAGWGVGGIEAEAAMLGQPWFSLPEEWLFQCYVGCSNFTWSAGCFGTWYDTFCSTRRGRAYEYGFAWRSRIQIIWKTEEWCHCYRLGFDYSRVQPQDSFRFAGGVVCWRSSALTASSAAAAPSPSRPSPPPPPCSSCSPPASTTWSRSGTDLKGSGLSRRRIRSS